MSAPIVDGAIAALDTVRASMVAAFDPASSSPPLGGGSTTVHLLAADGIPTSMWDAHTDDYGCDEPFLWVRLTRRYRSLSFPSPTIANNACGSPVVLVVEVGVGRCAVADVSPTWEQYADEAEVSLDDSWRIERALCHAIAVAVKSGVALNASVDSILPYGPEGGVLAWTGMAYIQL